MFSFFVVFKHKSPFFLYDLIIYRLLKSFIFENNYKCVCVCGGACVINCFGPRVIDSSLIVTFKIALKAYSREINGLRSRILFCFIRLTRTVSAFVRVFFFSGKGKENRKRTNNNSTYIHTLFRNCVHTITVIKR